eukprot:g12071.t1
MDRETNIGETYRMQISAGSAEASSQTLQGQKLESSNKTLSISMLVVVEVLALHEDNSVKSAALAIERVRGEYNGKPVEIDIAKRLIATGDADGYHYAYEEGEAIEQAEVIELIGLFGEFLFSDRDPGEEGEANPSEQVLFNLEEPRAVGSTWKCNEELLAKDLTKDGLLVDPKDIKSRVSFIDLQTHHDVKCANLDISVQVEKVSLPSLDQQGLDLDQSEIDISINGLLPLDPEVNGGTFKLGMEMLFAASADLPQGKMRFEMDAEKSLEVTYLPMK